MIMSLVKSYIASKVTKFLKANKDNISKIKTTIATWIERLEKIIALLKSILAKTDDDELSAKEIDEIGNELIITIKGF